MLTISVMGLAVEPHCNVPLNKETRSLSTCYLWSTERKLIALLPRTAVLLHSRLHARRLFDLKVDVNETPAKYNGRTALQGAAEYGRIDMLQLLLDEGALNVGEGEPQYRKAIELAERNGHNAAVRLLRSWKDSVSLSP
jgi:hypothetical protein